MSTRLSRLAERVAAGRLTESAAADRLLEDGASFAAMTKEELAAWPGVGRGARVAKVGFVGKLSETMGAATGVVLVEVAQKQVTVESASETAGTFYALEIENADEAEQVEAVMPDPVDAETLEDIGFQKVDA